MAELVRLDVDYEEIAILTSLSNLKQFIRLRDNDSALYVVKVNGYLGISALLLENGDVILEQAKLKAIFLR